MQVKNTYLLPVSQKGQITIPIEIRRLLGLEKQKKAVIEVAKDKKVILKQPKYSLEQVFACVKPIKKSFSEIRKIAKTERLEKNK